MESMTDWPDSVRLLVSRRSLILIRRRLTQTKRTRRAIRRVLSRISQRLITTASKPQLTNGTRTETRSRPTANGRHNLMVSTAAYDASRADRVAAP